MELKFDTEKEYAVVLEGGGAKGAYEIGVWKALEEAGVKYNAVDICASFFGTVVLPVPPSGYTTWSTIYGRIISPSFAMAEASIAIYSGVTPVRPCPCL